MMAETDTPKPAPRVKAMPPRRRVSEVLPSGNLWPDLPRREISDLLDKDMLIKDFSLLNGRFGKFAVIMATFPDSDDEFTTACGGEVVVRKLDELKEKRELPILGAISYNDKYYDLT